ncbi:MAG: NUDIX domain-containing protein [Gammaproteobacteria bacterium]|nr:NUDIX domain-containing protein [Gammaproteobacteria bacterium]
MKPIKQQLSAEDIKIKNKTLLHDGFCRVERYELEQKRFDGSWTPPFTREFIAKPVAVGALPYDPRTNQVVLIEQFRIGALGRSNTPWLIEIVAGIKDKEHAESDEEVIRREMYEEAGLEIETLLPICDYFTTPGCTTEKVKLFCAKVDATKAPKFCGLKEEHEDLKIHVISTEDAFAAVRSGQINNGTAIITLQWLELNLQEVNKRWKI